MLALLDEMMSEARAVGACNVIRIGAGGQIAGTMLDGKGFVAGVRSRGHRLEGKRVLLVGAGGAAAGIAHALTVIDGLCLSIANRDASKAHALAAAAGRGAKAMASPVAADYDVIINATSLGMNADDPLPIALDGIRNGSLVCDVVVGREMTNLLQEAVRRGAIVHPGNHMLAAQLELMLQFMLGRPVHQAGF
ncbi:hypothetical protein [Mesorhizobium sp.]|uniref:shikimate dehydrogenase family protein n=1 Tax=Mesorhizobium sp. TaxID=1871066 RepID=UPI003420388A